MELAGLLAVRLTQANEDFYREILRDGKPSPLPSFDQMMKWLSDDGTDGPADIVAPLQVTEQEVEDAEDLKAVLARYREMRQEWPSSKKATKSQREARAMLDREILTLERSIKRATSAPLPRTKGRATWPKCGHPRSADDTVKGGKAYPSGRCWTCERERCQNYYAGHRWQILGQQDEYRRTMPGTLAAIRKNAARRGVR
jgi:hypothetical protein